jgi:hypothetical protein
LSVLEPVFVASTAAEADRVEQILKDEGIEFAQRLEPSLEDTNRVCYLGTVFEVATADVERCKRILRDRGLVR